MDTTLCFGALGVLVASGAACAGPVTFEFGDLYTGNAPSGAGPWLRADLDQAGNGVRLTLTSLLNDADEFITSVAFNFFSDATDVEDLQLSLVSGQAAEGIEQDDDGLAGWGNAGMKFDLGFDFETANNPDRFTMGEVSVYDIVAANGNPIAPEDFVFLTDKGDPPYLAAFHAQGIEDGGSGKVGAEEMTIIPLPAGAALAGVGLAGIGLRRRR